ncbi:MAG: hypothetical protein JWN99_2079 [Ilumatobacteraceae bacterium]|nr:hypothetical protein [Ilumatobacteraceae bacterium]
MLSIEFEARGRLGTVSVTVHENTDPASVGCDSSALGFPVCRATVTHPAEGYDALFGWVQLVGTCAPGEPQRTFTNDPLRIYEGLDTPFGFHGMHPTLFDGPSRRDRSRPLDWLAHSFLCTAPSDPMDREVLPVLGFSWGFVLDDRKITIVSPQLLHSDSWTQHIASLEGQFGSWSFLSPIEGQW